MRRLWTTTLVPLAAVLAVACGGSTSPGPDATLNDIADIMANDATSGIFDLGMKAFGIKTQTAEHLFNLIETPEGDVLAAFLARLNLYADPKPIPPADIQQAMWEYYLATWRPGMENWKRWEGVYGQALSAVPA